MMPFPWQAALAAQLETRIEAGDLPHALLVAGPPGWGERHLAGWLALRLLKVATSTAPETLAHPDLRWIEPEGAAIKVEAARALVAFSHGTPQSGTRKVAVITEAHFLNDNAANALLKTLEEPPAGTHLLLSTAHPGRLLPTIRSRCQAINIAPDPGLAREWLMSKTEDADVERRLFEHGGAPVAVLAGIERGEQPLDALLERALRPGDTAAVVQALLEPGLAATLGRWYRYVCALAAGDWRVEQLAGVPARSLMEFADELTWARRQLVSSNSPNDRLLAERILARWRHLLRRL